MICQHWPELRAFLVLPLQVLEGIVRLPIALHDTLVSIERTQLLRVSEIQQRIHTEQAELLASHAVVASTLWNMGSDFRADARRVAEMVMARYPRVGPAPAAATSLLEQIKKAP